ncbi:MAG: hypothetical protein J3Q66DRAFT_371935 [Benniella sp.]|nr:MAG: hypothetical protein J3Q66DRAFT_371935 [Benniella sp.]
MAKRSMRTAGLRDTAVPRTRTAGEIGIGQMDSGCFVFRLHNSLSIRKPLFSSFLSTLGPTKVPCLHSSPLALSRTLHVDRLFPATLLPNSTLHTTHSLTTPSITSPPAGAPLTTSIVPPWPLLASWPVIQNSREFLRRFPNASSDVDLFGSLRGPDDGRYIGYAPSSDALLSLLESRKSPLLGHHYHHTTSSSADVNEYEEPYTPPPDPYPSWTADKQVPLTLEEIEGIVFDLTRKFGFQEDNMRNQLDALMTMLDSRASRIGSIQALTTIHADYIGGEHANYRKW